MKMPGLYFIIAGALWVGWGCGPLSKECTLGEPGNCPLGTVCFSLESSAAGEKGECTVGELDEEGRLRVDIWSWKIVRPGEKEEIPPLRFDVLDTERRQLSEADADNNPKAGWLGTGPAELYLEAAGSADTQKKMHVHALGHSYACKPVRLGLADCLWRCELPEAWAGEGPETEVEISLGAQDIRRKRVYRTSTATPALSLELNSTSLLLGEELLLCASQKGDLEVPVEAWEIESIRVAQGSLEIPMAWRPEKGAGEAPSMCWRAKLPLSAPMGEGGPAQLSASLKVKNAAGNPLTLPFESSLSLSRLACKTGATPGLGGAFVTEPLAFFTHIPEPGTGLLAMRELVFAASGWPNAAEANNSLYFYEGSCGEKEVTRRFHSGSVRGPMVVLGNTQRMAVALIGGGPPSAPLDVGGAPANYSATHLAAVNVRRQLFSVGCGASHLQGAPLFDKGVTLFHMGDNLGNRWRYAAPLNPTAPHANWSYLVNSECIHTAAVTTDIPIYLAPVQVGGPQEEPIRLITRMEWHLDTVAYWEPVPQGIGMAWNWRENGPILKSITEGGVKEPTGLAATGQNVWLSGKSTVGPSLQRWEFGLANPRHGLFSPQPESMATSPAAIDAEGRAYVVVEASPGVFQLRRFAPQAVDNEGPQQFVVLPPGTSKPVGSPLLGQPAEGAPAELYVVTTAGTVLVFEAERLAFLWKAALDITLSEGAQPLLTTHEEGGGLLWAVGERGEVRGLRVASEGLSRTAHWPKAFHDNCNTSSRQATPETMPNCF